MIRCHEAGHSLLGAPLVEATELGVDPRGAIGGPGPLVDLADEGLELGVPGGMGRQGPLLPVVVAGAGDLEHAAHPLDAVVRGMVGDEPEAGHRVVSLAK